MTYCYNSTATLLVSPRGFQKQTTLDEQILTYRITRISLESSLTEREIVSPSPHRETSHRIKLFCSPFLLRGYFFQWRVQTADVIGQIAFVTHDLCLWSFLAAADMTPALLTHDVRVVLTRVTFRLVLT